MQEFLLSLIDKFGNLGVFLAMFFESSILPIPSEVVIIGASAAGMPFAPLLIFGALGSTLGGIVGYCLGRYAAMPILLKFGRFILIKPQAIHKAEEFSRKYGVISVFIGRVVPIIPFKFFSIAAGIVSIPFVPFVLCTLAGVLPRIVVLAIFGAAVAQYSKVVVLLVFFAMLIFFAFRVLRLIYIKRDSKFKGGNK